MKSKFLFGDKVTNSNTDPKTYAAIYKMHKYWAKKPHYIINDYIQKYSKKNNIILEYNQRNIAKRKDEHSENWFPIYPYWRLF